MVAQVFILLFIIAIAIAIIINGSNIHYMYILL